MKDPELIVQYFPDSDTLRLGAGEPPAEGETIAQWLMVEWNSDEVVTGVVLRNAAKVLRPYLFPDDENSQGTSSDELEHKVDGATKHSSSSKSTRESLD